MRFAIIRAVAWLLRVPCHQMVHLAGNEYMRPNLIHPRADSLILWR